MKKVILTVALFCTVAFGGECYTASGKAFSDAQSMRKVCKSMNWKVGKSVSLTAATFVKGKVALYPQGRLEVCIRENHLGELQFKAQSSSSDAEEALWRSLPGTKF